MSEAVSTVTSDRPLTTSQVAERYAVNKATVARWADEGLIPSFRTPSGHRRFHAADVDAAIAATSTTTERASA